MWCEREKKNPRFAPGKFKVPNCLASQKNPKKRPSVQQQPAYSQPASQTRASTEQPAAECAPRERTKSSCFTDKEQTCSEGEAHPDPVFILMCPYGSPIQFHRWLGFPIRSEREGGFHKQGSKRPLGCLTPETLNRSPRGTCSLCRHHIMYVGGLWWFILKSSGGWE